MANTINMEDLRHLNLFYKITRIRTRYCFNYNNMLMFCVPKSKIPQALGKNGENLKKISEIVKKRIRILPQPRGIEDIEQFIKAIINPVTFNNLEMKEDEIIINAGQQNKAALLGRNKRRLAEMQRIIKDFFGKNYKII